MENTLFFRIGYRIRTNRTSFRDGYVYHEEKAYEEEVFRVCTDLMAHVREIISYKDFIGFTSLRHSQNNLPGDWI